jgi:hypothetical protein
METQMIWYMQSKIYDGKFEIILKILNLVYFCFTCKNGL